jgi:hypothetical protein
MPAVRSVYLYQFPAAVLEQMTAELVVLGHMPCDFDSFALAVLLPHL